MKNGDEVVITRQDGSIFFGTIEKMDVIKLGDENYHSIKINGIGIIYVNSNSVTLKSDTELVISGGYFEKEELLEIINQEKSAEEILLDLKDHLTN